MSIQTGELSLRDYLVVLRRRWLLIAAVTVVAAALGFVGSVTRTKQYSASAEVLIDFELSAQLTDPAAQGRSITDRQRRLENELRYASSDAVTEIARQDLQDGGASVSVTVDANADIITFTATSTRPSAAALEANAFANAYTSSRAAKNAEKFNEALTSVETVLEDLRGKLQALSGDDGAEADVERASLQQQIQTYEARRTAYGLLADANKDTSASVINPAKPSTVPISPKPMRTAVLALTLGLLATTGLAFLLEFLDDKLRTKEDLEAAAAAPTLALIPRNKEQPAYSPVMEPEDSLLAESFRSLRTAIRFASIRQPIRSLQVTSANPNEGKTTVATYLAVAMARLGNPVVLIDADLRNPSVHTRFGLGVNDLGLAAVLLRQASLSDAMHGIGGAPNLWALPSGPAPANPADFLWPVGGPASSMSVADVVQNLADAGYFVIVDTPPVLPVTDAVTTSRAVDATVFVTNAGTTQAKAVQRALEQLDRADARVVGTVLNRSSEAMGGYRYGYRQEAQHATAVAPPLPMTAPAPVPAPVMAPAVPPPAAPPPPGSIPVPMAAPSTPMAPATNGHHPMANGNGAALAKLGRTAPPHAPYAPQPPNNGAAGVDLVDRLRDHLRLE